MKVCTILVCALYSIKYGTMRNVDFEIDDTVKSLDVYAYTVVVANAVVVNTVPADSYIELINVFADVVVVTVVAVNADAADSYTE